MYRESKEIPSTETKHPCLTRWRKRIDEAKRRGKFTDQDKRDARSWDACAVWESHDSYGLAYAWRTTSTSGLLFCPVDDRICDLGGRFAGAVWGDNFSWCTRLITAIEQRLAELAR